MKFGRKEAEIMKECKYMFSLLENQFPVYWLRTHPYTGLTRSGAFVDTCRKGCPDFTVLVNGKYVGFEVKRSDGKGKQSIVQKDAQKKIEDSGGLYFIVEDIMEVREIVLKLCS